MAPPPTAAAPPAAAAAPVASSAPKDYTETRIQIRQTDGKPLVQTFKVKEPLSAVRLFAELNRKDLPGEKVGKWHTFIVVMALVVSYVAFTGQLDDDISKEDVHRR